MFEFPALSRETMGNSGWKMKALFLEDLIFGSNLLKKYSRIKILLYLSFWAISHLDSFTLHNIILNVVFMISGLTDRFINGFTFFGTFSFANQRCMTELNGFITCNFFVLNETLFGESFYAMELLTLRQKMHTVSFQTLKR